MVTTEMVINDGDLGKSNARSSDARSTSNRISVITLIVEMARTKVLVV